MRAGSAWASPSQRMRPATQPSATVTMIASSLPNTAADMRLRRPRAGGARGCEGCGYSPSQVPRAISAALSYSAKPFHLVGSSFFLPSSVVSSASR